MPTLTELFEAAARLARSYDVSELAYRQLMQAALAFEAASNAAGSPDTKEKTDEIVAISVASENIFYDAENLEDFLKSIEKSGAKILRPQMAFIRPSADVSPDPDGDGEDSFEGAVYQPRLQEVIKALRSRNVFFDDLVIDIGILRQNQMRKYPYAIITVPRLNIQIAVSNQDGEAMFVANPSIQLMDWAVFEKPQAGQEGTVFQNVKRVIHRGAWQERLLDTAGIGPEGASVGQKIALDAYVKAHRREYPITESMIIAMAKLYRARHPERQWPNINSGPIDPEIVFEVTGSHDWQPENWELLDQNLSRGDRGLPSGGSLKTLLEQNGCHYNLTKQMIVAFASKLHEKWAKEGRYEWPTGNDDTPIPHEIVAEVTGDPLWQVETFKKIDTVARVGQRGLQEEKSVTAIIREAGGHYDLTEAMILEMARLCRAEHDKKQWPWQGSGPVPRHIVVKATGNPFWRNEDWGQINATMRTGGRGLPRAITLPNFLAENQCDYNLVRNNLLLKILQTYKARGYGRPQKNTKPNKIPHDIIKEVTGDENWQEETFAGFNKALSNGNRGFAGGSTLSKFIDDNFTDGWDSSIPKGQRKRNRNPQP